MAWIDPKTGRRYNDNEVAELEMAHSADTFQAPENVAQPPRELTPLQFGEEVLGGAKNSLKRSYLGAKQLGTYALGDDASREAVNQEIQQLQDENAPLMDTAGGRLGDFLGNSAQFIVPGMIASKVGKVLPAATNVIRSVTGEPGSVLRNTLTSAAFEGLQPETPSDLGTGTFGLNKAAHIGMGVAIGAPTAKVSNLITKPYLQVDPERAALAKEAERLGMKLTPAQRTGDRTLQQYEEGLASKPGSGKLIAEARAAQQKILNAQAAKSLGVPHEAPNEAALALARETAAKGYEPLASIPKMSPDVPYWDSLDKFIAKQGTKATGSTDAAAIAMRLKKGSGKATGETFLEELQGVRDLGFGARQKGDVATAKQLMDLSKIMEDFAERRVGTLASTKGSTIPPDALKQMQQARTDYAKLHAVEKAADPVTGNVSALKYLNQEFKRKPASRGPGSSPVEEGLRDVGASARVMKQTLPYIGSSGTAERQAGQQMVEMTTGPWTAIKGGVPLAKNYLAAKYYLNHGGEPGFVAKYLSPEQNMMVRRMLPQEVIAGKKAMED